MKSKLLTVLSTILIFLTCAFSFGCNNSTNGEYFLVEGSVIKGLTEEGKEFERITIPKKINGVEIKKIDESAFSYNQNLVSITIQDGVESLGMFAFQGCSKLEEVNLPSSIKTIGFAVFRYCDELKRITIPSGVTYLDSEAFRHCYSLIYVELPKTITNISREVFANCPSLTTINYNGTLERWNKINKDMNWDKSSRVQKVICIDGELEI